MNPSFVSCRVIFFHNPSPSRQFCNPPIFSTSPHRSYSVYATLTRGKRSIHDSFMHNVTKLLNGASQLAFDLQSTVFVKNHFNIKLFHPQVTPSRVLILQFNRIAVVNENATFLSST